MGTSPTNWASRAPYLFSFCTIPENTEMDLCVCDNSCIASATFDFCCIHTATERTVDLDSSPADLAAYQHSQDSLHNFKRGTLLPSRDWCEQNRRPRSGSVTRFVLCWANVLGLNVNVIFNGITHYLRSDSAMLRQKSCSTMNILHSENQVTLVLNMSCCVFVAFISSYFLLVKQMKSTLHQYHNNMCYVLFTGGRITAR